MTTLHESTARCVHHLYEEQAAATPRAIAVRYGDRSLDYQELDMWANRIAHGLRAAGVRRGDRVGLHGPRSADYIAAMLGVLKAGAAYLPLELGLPEGRLEVIAQDAAPCLILTVGPLPTRWSPIPARTVEEIAAGTADGAPMVAVHPDDVMYVPYTSGSTGRPKGVEVPHRSLPGLYGGEPFGPWGPGETVLHHTSLSWDGHAAEIFSALLHGGTVEVFPGDSADPFEVVGYAVRTGVSLLLLPTQAFNTVASADPALLGGVGCIVIGGEAASPDHVADALAAAPGLRVVNGYGPVECTAAATVHEIRPADTGAARIPIGRPAGDRTVYVLDDSGRPVRDGTPGFAYVGGPAVACGYLGRPALTAERFVPDPYSGRPGARLFATGDLVRRDRAGLFDFLGRADDQVKLRGFRIEPGEVEVALREHEHVRDACVALWGHGDQARLIGYVIRQDPAADPADIRASLRTRLAAAMVPAVIVFVDRFPTTHTGKIDRKALRPPVAQPAGPDRTSPDHADPAAPAEASLARIWAQYLGLEPAEIAGTDNFFDLGGHSLAASKVALRVRRDFGVVLQVRDLFDTPVLNEFAALVHGLGGLDPDLASPPGSVPVPVPDLGAADVRSAAQTADPTTPTHSRGGTHD